MADSVFELGSTDIVKITRHDIEKLKDCARDAPLKRARYVLHRHMSDPVHEMIIALMPDGYIRPHRHPGKCESFHLIEGQLRVVFFDADGKIIDVVRMGTSGENGKCIYRMNQAFWHTVLVDSEVAVVHETTMGPFIPGQTEFAAWSPDGNVEKSALDYTAKVRTLAQAFEERS